MSNKYLSNHIKRPEITRGNALLIITLISILCSAIFLRILPAKYGFYLNEFDPYYNYRAVEFIIKNLEEHGINGIVNYINWQDIRTWYPEGRPVLNTSQVGLHLTGATTYLIFTGIFGKIISIYDFLVLFPVIIGSLTTLMMFLLVRNIAGNTAGIFSALMIAFSPAIIVRGNLGWFKSEPLAILIGISAFYLFLKIQNRNIKLNKMILTSILIGTLLGFGNTTWGGAYFFIIVYAATLLLTPLIVRNYDRLIQSAIIIVSFTFITTAIFPRPGLTFIFGPVGFLLVSSLLFLILAKIIKVLLQGNDEKIKQNLNKTDKFLRNTPRHVKILIILIVAIGISGTILFITNSLAPLTERYLTVLLPFQKTANPLVESVSEHFSPTGQLYFTIYSILIILSAFGAIQTIRKRSINYIFVAIIGILSIYFSSSFSRLLVFSSIGISILASIGFVTLNSIIFKKRKINLNTKMLKQKQFTNEISREVKILYSVIIIIVLFIPAIHPTSGWITASDTPTTLASSSINTKQSIPDWKNALDWIENNTEEDSVFIAWWDYGYWITVEGNRTTVADNATINQTRIEQIATMFMSDHNEGERILRELKGDYVVIFISGIKVFDPENNQIVYRLGLGGDESKKQWFIKIAGLNSEDYLYNDRFTGKPNFWNNTMLGKMIPLEFVQYVDLTKGEFMGNEYKDGGRTIGVDAVYVYREKFTEDDNLKLVFSSPSMNQIPEYGSEIFAAVLIYEIK